MIKIRRQFVLLSVLLSGVLIFGQAPTPVPSASNNDVSNSSPAIQPASTPCASPAEVFDIDEYDGPFNKLVARFTRKLEIKTVHAPHKKPHTPLCSLDMSGKFHLFLENSFEPVNFLDAGWDAAIAQISDDDPPFGQGAAGFGKRYGVALLDNLSGDFFNTFFYPAVFQQDPRYYRLGHGSFHVRFFHALRHTFVAHGDSGHLMPNYSEWFGTASAKALSNLYHPGNERGFGTTAQRAGISISTDMAFDVFREFWPEITHKLHLPFRPRQNEWATNSPAAVDPAKRSPEIAKPAPSAANPAVDATHQ
jgi:hypothetical protein